MSATGYRCVRVSRCPGSFVWGEALDAELIIGQDRQRMPSRVPGYPVLLNQRRDRRHAGTRRELSGLDLSADESGHLLVGRLVVPYRHPDPQEDSVPFLPPPKRPLGEYTTSELNQRRREPEHAVKALAGVPIRAELAELLADVEAEEKRAGRSARPGRADT